MLLNLHLEKKLEFIVLTDTLNIATDDEPQLFVVFVSNGSGTKTEETDSETTTAREKEVDDDVINSKTDTKYKKKKRKIRNK